MIETVHVAPPHSLIFVMGAESADFPDLVRGGGVSWTQTCILVTTLAEVDGETAITLTDEPPPSDLLRGLDLACKTVLRTPSGEVQVCDTSLEALLALKIWQECVTVEIWTNDRTDPDRIVVIVGPPDLES